MAKYENLPFPRGEAQTEAAFAELLGREYEIEDVNWGSSEVVKPHRSGKMVRLRLVKNEATVALTPKKLVRYSTTAGEYGTVVDGFCRTTAEDWAGVVDEFLPTAGAAVDSYFYIVVEGPTKVVTPDAGSAFNGDITVGAALVAATAAASTGSTAGRVQVQNITAGSQDTDMSSVINNAMNALGRALSAATTGNTATDILAEIGRL